MSKNSALRSRAGRLSKPVKSALKVSGPRRDGRVVECVGLEIRYTVMLYRGFESLSLLQYTRKPCYRKSSKVFLFLALNGVRVASPLPGGHAATPGASLPQAPRRSVIPAKRLPFCPLSTHCLVAAFGPRGLSWGLLLRGGRRGASVLQA